MNGTGGDNGLPIEQFIQALTTQLDHAQSAMAVKAKNLNLPLTFALKDIALDLRAHVEVVKSEVRIRPASAGDGNASTIRLALTTITRPMIEENAAVMPVDPEGSSLKRSSVTTSPKKTARSWNGPVCRPWLSCAICKRLGATGRSSG